MCLIKTKISFELDSDIFDRFHKTEYLWGLLTTETPAGRENREKALTLGQQKGMEYIMSYEALKEAKNSFYALLPQDSDAGSNSPKSPKRRMIGDRSEF